MKTDSITAYGPWGGGKRGRASAIAKLVGNPKFYAEPFFGGGAVIHAFAPCEYELLADRNPRIINVLEVLQKWPKEVSYRLGQLPFDEMVFENSLELAHVGIEGFDAAVAQLVVWWMGPGGIAGTTIKPWFAKRNTNTGGCPEVRWNSFRNSLPTLAARIRNANVRHQDFGVTLDACPDEPTTSIYLDPPYLSKEFKYEFDFGHADHSRLALHLNTFEQSRIVVSYRDDAEGGLFGDTTALDEMYPESKWRRVRIEMAKAMSHASGKSVRNTEILLVNDGGLAC